MADIVDYSDLIKEYEANKPSSLEGFTNKLSEYRSGMSQWRSMFAYTLWQAHLKGFIQADYPSARDYVNANMGAILGHISDNEAYVTAIAGVVDVIFNDMLQLLRDENPYLDENGKVINPNDLIFNPRALTHCYTFKGFYAQTYKWEEKGIKSYDECYEIRQALLNMFLNGKRDEIKAFKRELEAEMIQEEKGKPSITVMTCAMTGEESENMYLELELDGDAFRQLESFVRKQFGVELLQANRGGENGQ